tara:strand:+ start:228 stop:443 length:216 start_codon:yes stop_codon:yes gene_type:complete
LNNGDLVYVSYGKIGKPALLVELDCQKQEIFNDHTQQDVTFEMSKVIFIGANRESFVLTRLLRSYNYAEEN